MNNSIQIRSTILLMAAFLFCFTINVNAQQTKSKASQISNASKQTTSPMQAKNGKVTTDTKAVTKVRKQKKVIHEPGKGPDYNETIKSRKTLRKKADASTGAEKGKARTSVKRKSSNVKKARIQKKQSLFKKANTGTTVE